METVSWLEVGALPPLSAVTLFGSNLYGFQFCVCADLDLCVCFLCIFYYGFVICLFVF